MSTTNSLIGKTLSKRYEILRPLGEGGMGKVYLAKDKRFGKQVVVKVPTMEVGDKDFKDRFMREIASIATLEHAHIVPTIDWGEMEGIPFLVLRYLSGGSLRDRITDAKGFYKPMPLEGLNQWLPQIASALDYIHSKNWVHRDLKPDNILFDESGSPYLADFGIAKTLKGSAMGVKTSLGSVIGTPQYMAPEMHLGKGIGPRADQFGLAVLVYEALAGKVPFEATTSTAIFMEIMQGNAKPILEIVSNIPLKKSKALLRGMAKEAKDRFENCVEMSNAITGGKLEPVMPKVVPVIIETISNSQVNTLSGELQKPSILPTRVESTGQVNESKTNKLASKSTPGPVDPPIFKTMIESNKISALNSELSPPLKLESSIKNNDGSENFLNPPGHQNLEFDPAPPFPPPIAQSNLLLLLNKFNKVLDSAKNLIQSDKTKEKVAQIKTHWDRSSNPIKFAVIGVSGFLALLVVWSVFSWMFGSSSIYARAFKIFEQKHKDQIAIFNKKYGSVGKVPSNENKEAFNKLKKDTDLLLNAVNPPPIQLDASANDIIQDVQVLPPKLESLGFLGYYADFKLKYQAKINLPKNGKVKLIVKSYSNDGTIVKESAITQDENASAKDKVSGSFSIEFDKLSEVASLKIFKKND